MEKVVPYLRAIGMSCLLIGFIIGFIFPLYSIHTLLFMLGGVCFITTFGYSLTSFVRWYLNSSR